jgi:hypothetical protein
LLERRCSPLYSRVTVDNAGGGKWPLWITDRNVEIVGYGGRPPSVGVGEVAARWKIKMRERARCARQAVRVRGVRMLRGA